MGLIQLDLNTEQKMERTLAKIDEHTLNALKETYYRLTQIDELIWANPLGLTPDQALKALGTRGVEFAKVHGHAQAMVNLIDDSVWQMPERDGAEPVLDKEGKPTGELKVKEKKKDSDLNVEAQAEAQVAAQAEIPNP